MGPIVVPMKPCYQGRAEVLMQLDWVMSQSYVEYAAILLVTHTIIIILGFMKENLRHQDLQDDML